MNHSIIARQENLYLHLCVTEEEVNEVLRLCKQLGYTITHNEKLGLKARFHRRKSTALTYLRQEVKKRNRSGNAQT